jgi:hypothetical protein
MMMKAMMVVLGVALLTQSAAGFDHKRVSHACQSHLQEGRKAYRHCVMGEQKAGMAIDRLAAIGTDPKHKNMLRNCREMEPESYVRQFSCLAMATTDLGELPGTLPSFETAVLCKAVSDNVGGSYQIELACEEQEAEASAALKRFFPPADLMKICVPVALNVGGSYQILLTCVEAEAKAKASLQ